MSDLEEKADALKQKGNAKFKGKHFFIFGFTHTLRSRS